MAGVSPIAKYKLVILGDESVGKTSIITRFIHDRFDPTYQGVCIDILSKRLYLEDRTVRLQFWDTSGQERFRFPIPSYIRDSSIAIIVYDVANRQSFLNTSKWIEEVCTERGSNVIIVLVGNKTDIVDKRQVSIEAGNGKAREFEVMFLETSAKSGYNIEPLFRKIVAALPRMDNVLSTKPEDMVDANLKSMAKANTSDHQGVSYLKKHKVVFLGDESVGKSSIISSYMYDTVDPAYRVKDGIEFIHKTVYMEDRTVRLKFCDTGGQDIVRSLIPSYIRGSEFVVIVYDVTNRRSFLHISKWIEEVRTQRGSNVIIVLAGNKTDLVDKRQVSIEEGDCKAREFGAMFLETSARDGFNIEMLFLSIALNVEVYNNPSGRNPSNFGDQQRSPQVYKPTPPNQMLPHQPKEQDFKPQHPELELPAPQASSSGKSLEDIMKNLSGKSIEEVVKNLAITQQQYQQDTRAGLKNLEKTIGQLVASIENLEGKESFSNQTEVNQKPSNP